MRRIFRLILISGCLLLFGLGAAYAYYLYCPAPDPPRLSAPIQRGNITVGQMTRSYRFYVPARLAAKPPLLLVLHGATSSAEQMRQVTGYRFEHLADEHGLLLVYPEGYERHWNDCRKRAPYAAKRLGIDDVGFMRVLVTRFRASHNIDSARVYVVGYSNGAHLGYRLALEAPELIRAVAAVAANLPSQENSDCSQRPGVTPVLILNGTDDPINPYSGGIVTLFGFADRGRVRSAWESAAYFAQRNAISDAPLIEDLPQAGSPPISVQRARWNSAAGGEVVLYTVRGGGHTLPQPGVQFPRILGRTHSALDGPAEIWNFFARHGGAP